MMNTRNWKADEHTDFGGGNRTLTVGGEVELSNTNQSARLEERVPQGIDPTTLLLDLIIETSGIGNPVMTWRSVEFEKAVTEGQHALVDVYSDGDKLMSLKVEQIIS